MGFEAAATAYGRAAVEVLARQVAELKAGDPLAPVTVLVPSNYAAVAGRRALAAQPGGIANVTFTTVQRLAERLGAPALAAAGRRPISMPVLVAAVRAVLADDPGIFAPVAIHPTTEQALAGATRELAGVSDQSLDAVAACSARAADVVRIARATHDRLSAEWYDEHDLLSAATDVVTDIGPVILHLLQDITPAAADLLHAIAQHTTIPVNVGITGSADADRAVLDAHARIGITVDTTIEVPRATRIVTVSDPDDEVRAALRSITQWMRDGVRLGRVAVLYATTDPYARLLEEHLDAAGIPRNGAPVRAAGELLFGRTLQCLLALPDRDFRRVDVVGLLTSSLVKGVPGRAWDRISREAGVVDGTDWAPRLATFANEARSRADELERDGKEGAARHLRADADRADALAAFVVDLRAALTTDATTWRGLAAWATGVLDTYLGDDWHRRHWPAAELEAAQRVEAALERLAGLDAVDDAPTLDVFRRTLDAELESSLRRVGKLDQGVLVGHVSMATGLVLDRVVVLGLAEGSFPARRLDDSLLPDSEREHAHGELRLRADRIHDDHRFLRVALASADESVVCFPRGDLRRNGERAASRWLLDDASLHAAKERLRTADLETITASWLDVVPSYGGGLARVAFPATAQDHRLASIARGGTVDDPIVAMADTVIRARRSGAFTRFDGNLTAVAEQLPPLGRTSASRLQAYASCPHRYFLEHVLHVEAVEEPERRFEIDHLSRGSLVHEILERFVLGGIGRDTWSGDDLQRLDVVTADVFAEYIALGVTGRDLFWRRDSARIIEDLHAFIDHDRTRLELGARPLAAEHRFGSLPIALPEGRSIQIGGSIDRVDRDEPNGSLHVIDYKTGQAKKEDRALSELSPHDHGRRLQLYLYAQAAKAEWGDVEVRGDYWFCTGKGGFALHGYWLTPEAEALVADAIATIVDGIDTGIFPARPSEQPGYKWVDCAYCSPDGGSDRPRRAEWERKRLDPALRAYVELAEGVVEDAAV